MIKNDVGGFEDYLAKHAKLVNDKLNEVLTKETSTHYIENLLGRSNYEYDNKAIDKSILDPAWYLMSLGGKRWRPVMMGLVIEALGKKEEDYREFLLIPEVIHNGTLVHDDIEDGSPMRRGSPSVHVKYGVDIGINLGDFMYYFPVVALIDTKKLSIETKNKAINVYVREMLRVCVGQATDIAWHNELVDPYSVGEQKYLQMAYNKTGVLPRMAAKLGAIIAEADDDTVEALGNFGATIGVAFQIQDDIMNITKSHVAETKGGVGDDITEGKITLMVIHALGNANKDDSKRLIDILKIHTREKKLIDEAIAIIERYDGNAYARKLADKLIIEAWKEIDKRLPETEAKRRLKQLADYMVSRKE